MNLINHSTKIRPLKKLDAMHHGKALIPPGHSRCFSLAIQVICSDQVTYKTEVVIIQTKTLSLMVIPQNDVIS